MIGLYLRLIDQNTDLDPVESVVERFVNLSNLTNWDAVTQQTVEENLELCLRHNTLKIAIDADVLCAFIDTPVTSRPSALRLVRLTQMLGDVDDYRMNSAVYTLRQLLSFDYVENLLVVIHGHDVDDCNDLNT
ncbi:hypothetical protein ACMFMF_010741 [Clarireedia jacksonii]